MKILFATKTLSATGGGAERVLSAITAELARRGHEIVVASFDPASSDTFYPFNRRVQLIKLGMGDVTRKTTALEIVSRTRALRSLVEQVRPDVAVGFMHSAYVPLALGMLGTGIPVIGSEHIVYEHYHGHPVEQLGLAISAPLMRKLTAISEPMREGFPKHLRKKMVLIGNPTMDHGRYADVRGNESKTLLCVGRLEPQKDHATLVTAFARIANDFPQWRLRILGEGFLRPQLEAQIRGLRMVERIEMPGAVTGIEDEYSAAQLFVLPSLYESFGLATAEAMTHGLPVIGFADCPGTNEIIENDVSGLLVSGAGDRSANLATAMAALMRSPDERQRLGQGARAAAFSSLESIGNEWERLLHSVAPKSLTATHQTARN